MNALQFDHELTVSCLRLRWSLNKAAQCMNHNRDALGKLVLASLKSEMRLRAATVRLERCMEAHGL